MKYYHKINKKTMFSIYYSHKIDIVLRFKEIRFEVCKLKNLLIAVWTIIVVMTLGVCMIIFNNTNTEKLNNKEKESLPTETSGALYIGDKPTLNMVTASIRSTTQSQSKGALGTNFEAPNGKGEKASGTASDSTLAVVSRKEEYSFSKEMYPYREMLSEEQQKAYDIIYTSVLARTSKCSLADCLLSENAVSDVVTAIFNDHPEFFWLDKDYTFTYVDSGRVLDVTMTFNDTANDFENTRTKFLKAANDIIEGASKLDTPQQKEIYVYNAIMDIATYDEKAPLNQSAYSALVNRKSVCAGYARAFQYIMQQLEIPCYFCSGYSQGGNHAWNIVKINENYYNVDISWDDTAGDLKKGYTYEFFNKSDEEFAKDHMRRGLSIKLPACD